MVKFKLPSTKQLWCFCGYLFHHIISFSLLLQPENQGSDVQFIQESTSFSSTILERNSSRRPCHGCRPSAVSSGIAHQRPWKQNVPSVRHHSLKEQVVILVSSMHANSRSTKMATQTWDTDTKEGSVRIKILLFNASSPDFFCQKSFSGCSLPLFWCRLLHLNHHRLRSMLDLIQTKTIRQKAPSEELTVVQTARCTTYAEYVDSERRNSLQHCNALRVLGSKLWHDASRQIYVAILHGIVRVNFLAITLKSLFFWPGKKTEAEVPDHWGLRATQKFWGQGIIKKVHIWLPTRCVAKCHAPFEAENIYQPDTDRKWDSSIRNQVHPKLVSFKFDKTVRLPSRRQPELHN